MKTFFKKSGGTVLAALIAVLVLLLLLSALGLGFHSLRGLFAPLDSLVSRGMNSLERVYAYMYKYDELEAENERLRAYIAEMEEEVRLSSSSNEENRRLRKLLNLSEERQDFVFEEATVISWTSSSWSSSFTINKGSKAGLEAGDCVVDENGFLIGRLTDVSAGTAQVETLLDPLAGVGAVVDRTGATAVTEGDYKLMKAGMVRLVCLSDSSDIVVGDTVVTSGKGGVYPSGLIIGNIYTVVADASGMYSYGVIAPSADIKTASNVFIIKDFDAEDAEG